MYLCVFISPNCISCDNYSKREMENAFICVKSYADCEFMFTHI